MGDTTFPYVEISNKILAEVCSLGVLSSILNNLSRFSSRPDSLRVAKPTVTQHWCSMSVITGSTAHSTSRRNLVYSEADFEVVRPTGATRCTDGGALLHASGFCPLLHAKFHPHRCNDKGVGPQKLKFLLRFGQNVEYKCPAGAYPLRDFHKICRICTPFQDALAVKIWLDLLQRLWSYGGFKLRGSGFPQIFSAP